MAKTGFGMPKQKRTAVERVCPKCGTRMELRRQMKVRINGVTYGRNGMEWVCTNVTQPDKKVEHYEEKCGYREIAK